MTARITYECLIELIHGDSELVAELVREQVITMHEDGFTAEEVDRVLVSHTLVREFGVGWPAVDIILRLREQLAHARRRLAERERSD